MEKVKVIFEFGKTLNWDCLSEHAVYSCERNGANRTKFWCAIVKNFKIAKVLDRKFLEFSYTAWGAIVEMTNVKQGDIHSNVL